MEIYYNNQWGTVCDDHWTLTEATIVCRTLDSPGVTEVVADTSRYIISCMYLCLQAVNFPMFPVFYLQYFQNLVLANQYYYIRSLVMVHVHVVVYYVMITSSGLVLEVAQFG